MKSAGFGSVNAFGVDGCKSGWFCISIEPSGEIGWFVFKTLGELAAMADDWDRIFVDIPIGLGDGPEERLCDREARRRLGSSRGSSVFPAPVRAALDARDYEEAKTISLAERKKSLSIQSWSILPKIREADELLRSSAKAKAMMREVHPEICFWALAGENSMRYRKKDRQGIDERIRVLQGVWPSAGREFVQICNVVPRTKVEKDDILDAMAAALTASGNLSELRTLPERPPWDARGLPMEMVYLPRSALGK